VYRGSNPGSAVVLLILTAGCLWTQPAADLYNRGLESFRHGDLDAAIRYLREATEQQPVYPEAFNTLGLLLGKKGQDPTSVLKAFTTATEQRENFAEAHYNLGLLLAQLGRIEDGTAELRKAIAYAPQNSDAYNALGLALMDRQIDESLRMLEKAIELRPDFAEAALNLALAYHRKYGTEREITQLHRVLVLDPRSVVARNILTRRLEETGRFDEALKMALETVQIAPESAEARLFAGKGLLRDGDVPAAIEQLQLATLADPSLVEAHHHLAVALRKLGRQEDASKEFTKAESLRETQHASIAANIQMSQVSSKLEAGDTDGAISVLRQVIQAKPRWADVRITLGRILLTRGDAAGASAQFAEAVRLAPNDFDAVYGLGYTEATKGAVPQAIPLFVRAAELRPSSLEAHYNLGSAYLTEKDFPAAVQEFRKAVSLSQSFVAAEEGLGAALLAANDPAQAIPPLTRALELKPDSAKALRLLASGQQMMGHKREADELLARAAALEAKEEKRIAAAGELDAGLRKLAQGDRAGALTQFREAARQAPDMAETHEFLGAALLDVDLDEAARELSLAVEIRPAYFEALYNRGLAAARKQQYDAAIRDLREAERINPEETKCHDSLGVAYGMRGNFAEAVAEFREAVRLKPEWALAHYHLGSALRFSGEMEGAKAAYAEAQQLDPQLKSPFAQ
jgi:Flp pilus assembly protein TadD